MSTLRFKYQTLEFDNLDIHFKTLRDKQEFEDKNDIALNLGISEATWALFGVIWPSSEVLAHTMDEYKTQGKRILEVGCGIGLTSLMLNSKDQDITATDYHPEVDKFLKDNTKLNNDKEIPYIRTGWTDESDALGSFDLIVGSDLLYERDHIELLSSFIDNHANKKCEVIIVDPGRGNSNKFTQRMVELGYEHSYTKPDNTDEYLDETFKGRILKYTK